MTRVDSLRRAALVFNPSKIDGAPLKASITRHSAASGWSAPLFLETTVDDPGQGITREALAAGATAVLVAGGDGTVRCVSEALAGTGVPLTILPCGTGNILARNLRLPLERAETMIAATFDGVILPIDIGVARLKRPDGSIEEHAFVVMAGMGLDAAMIANTNPAWKKQIGWIAYVDGAARSLPKAKPFRIVYHLDTGDEAEAEKAQDDTDERRTQARIHAANVQSVLVTNCGALPAGIELIPDSSLTDGALDIAIIQPSGVFGWLGVWRKVWWDNSVLRRFHAGRNIVERRKNASVRYLRGVSIETATPDPRPIELDGDELGFAARMLCSVRPGALLVTIPHAHSVASL